jgi:hypothetical protein
MEFFTRTTTLDGEDIYLELRHLAFLCLLNLGKVHCVRSVALLDCQRASASIEVGSEAQDEARLGPRQPRLQVEVVSHNHVKKIYSGNFRSNDHNDINHSMEESASNFSFPIVTVQKIRH